MILPPGLRGAAFGTAGDGDGRDDPAARIAISAELGIPADWVFLRQVHGVGVLRAFEPGPLGDGDAVYSTVPMLPMVVATADCLPVVLEGDGGAGIAHAGWRGAAAGVVEALCESMAAAGVLPLRAAIGPGIGPCCFEVGPEVTDRFGGFEAQTTWGTPSVDLAAAVAARLEGLTVWRADACTHCGEGYRSFRREGTALRQVGVAWAV